MGAFFLKNDRLSFLQLDRRSVTHTNFTSASGYNGAASNEFHDGLSSYGAREV